MALSGIAFSASGPAGAAVDPPLPRVKPDVPLHQPELSRALTADEKALKRAIQDTLHGNHERARIYLRKSKEPLGREIVEWLRLGQSDNNSEFSETAIFIEAHLHWPRMANLRANAERAIGFDATADLSDSSRTEWFRVHPPVSPTGAMTLAYTLLRDGQSEEASNMLRAAWREMSFTHVEEKEFLSRFAGQLTREDHLARLDRLLYARKRTASKRQAARLGEDYQKLARARLALAFRQPGVDWAIKQVPADLRDDTGLHFERIRWRYRKGRYEGVIELLDSPVTGRIDPAKLWRIRAWAARRAAAAKDFEKAYKIAADHGVDEGLGLAECEWLAGLYAKRGLGQPDLALKHFTRLHDNTTSPISKARGAYWSSQAASDLGREELSRTWLETAQVHDTAFYGQLAAYELGTPSPLVTSAPAPLHQKEDDYPAPDLVKVTILLDRLGFDRMVKTFVLHMAQQAENERDLQYVAHLSRRLDRLDLTLRAAKMARARGFILYGDLFPELPLPLAAGPEEALVLAVIRQESAFDQRAVSHAGARGLMQLMPATAKRVAAWEGVRYVRQWLTEEPDYNVRLGRAYLRKMIERYEGAYPLALAAYNAGPHRVDRWLKAYGDPRGEEISTVDWIENIPFNETRNYVQRVLEGLFVYRSRRSSQLTWSLEPPDGSS